jgi:hypothetical protein
VRGAQCPLTAGRVLWIVHVDVVTGGDAVFAFSAAGASATAREMDVGFVVLAGSTARGHGTGTFPAGYQALCEQLVQVGRLVDGPSPELVQRGRGIRQPVSGSGHRGGTVGERPAGVEAQGERAVLSGLAS